MKVRVRGHVRRYRAHVVRIRAFERNVRKRRGRAKRDATLRELSASVRARRMALSGR